LHEILKKADSLEEVFRQHYLISDENIGNALAGLIDAMTGIDTTPVYGDNVKPAGLLQFIPSPRKGSACKR